MAIANQECNLGFCGNEHVNWLLPKINVKWSKALKKGKFEFSLRVEQVR